MTPPRLSALDALSRGFLNVRANRELIGIQVAAGLLLAASIFVPLALFVVRLGVPLSVFTASDPQALVRALESVQLDLGQLASMLGIGLLLLLVVGTLVFILSCWFQAGTLAVLLAGEAQAPSSRQAPAAVFRTFSWSGFVGWASRYALRIFWINNLFVLFFTLLLLALSLPFLLMAAFSEERISAAACAMGCGLALPIGFVALVLVLAMIVAQICAVEEGATILGSTRRAFSITASRLGGLLLLYLLLALGWIAVATFFGGLGLMVKLALARAAMVQSVLSFLLGAVEFVASTTLTLAMTAAIVALVIAELRLRPAAPRPDA